MFIEHLLCARYNSLGDETRISAFVALYSSRIVLCIEIASKFQSGIKELIFMIIPYVTTKRQNSAIQVHVHTPNQAYVSYNLL